VAPDERAAALAGDPAPAEPEAAPAADSPAPHRAHRASRVRSARKALARIGAMADRGLFEYRRGKIDTARRLLQAALLACSTAGFDHHRVKAITHARLGLVLVGGYKQPELGVEQFRRALQIDPNVPLARRDVKPEVVAAFREAAART
jgi:hypothetical protein